VHRAVLVLLAPAAVLLLSHQPIGLARACTVAATAWATPFDQRVQMLCKKYQPINVTSIAKKQKGCFARYVCHAFCA
jgi:hypothetical protein